MKTTTKAEIAKLEAELKTAKGQLVLCKFNHGSEAADWWLGIVYQLEDEIAKLLKEVR